VVARRRRRRLPLVRNGDEPDVGVVVAVVAVDDDHVTTATRTGIRIRIGVRLGLGLGIRLATATAVGLGLGHVLLPWPVLAGVGAVPRLHHAVPPHVLFVERDAVVLGDVAHQLGRGVDEAVVPGRLAAEACVLDADGELVAADAVETARHTVVLVAVVVRRDVPALAALLDQLGDLAAGRVDDVVRRHARGRVLEPAPAAGVRALAGMNDDELRLGRAAAPARRVVGRGTPHRPRVVWTSGQRRHGGRHRDRRPSIDRHQLALHVAVFGVRDHALAHRRIDLVMHEHGASQVVLDPAELADDLRPRTDVGAVLDFELLRHRGQQRSRGIDVRHRLGARLLHRNASELSRLLERCPTQPHDSERRRAASELLVALHHLPARLDPSERLQHLHRHLVRVGGGGKLAVEPGRLRRGGIVIVVVGVVGLGTPDAGHGISAVALFDAAGEGHGERGGGQEQEAGRK